jgi:hypothetical protein
VALKTFPPSIRTLYPELFGTKISTAAPPFVTTLTSCYFDYVFLIVLSSAFFTSSTATVAYLFPVTLGGEETFFVYFLSFAEDFEAFKSTAGLISLEADLVIFTGFVFALTGDFSGNFAGDFAGDFAGVLDLDLGSLFFSYFLA